MLTLSEKVDVPKRPRFKLLRKLAPALAALPTAAICAVSASADTYTPETFQASDLNSVFTALNTQFNVSFVLSVIGAIITAAAALVAMWWGARKGTKILLSAFKRGKLRI